MFDNLRLHILAHGLRLSTGLLLFTSGISKLMNMDMYTGYMQNVQSIAFMKDIIVPSLPWIELILGLLLILGLFTQIVAVAATILFLGMSIFAGVTSMGVALQFHFFAFLTSLSLSLGGKQNGPTLDSMLMKRGSGKVEKIKV